MKIFLLFGYLQAAQELWPRQLDEDLRLEEARANDKSIHQDICRQFYNNRGVSNNRQIKTNYLAEGGQSVIWKCETTRDDIQPQIVALKSFKTVKGKNLTEIGEIDLQLTELGLRSTVYEFYEFGKIEQFLSGLKNFQNEFGQNIDFEKPEVYREMAKIIGKVHAADIRNIDELKYTRPMMENGTWWNTKLIKSHFNDLKLLLMGLEGEPTWDEFVEEVRVQIGIEDLDEQVDFVADTIDTYYNVKGDDAIVLW